MQEMLKNRLYVYGHDNVRVPAHLNFGKEVYDNMVKNKDKTALPIGVSVQRLRNGQAVHVDQDARFVESGLADLGAWLYIRSDNFLTVKALRDSWQPKIIPINADTGTQMTYGEVAQATADVALSLTRMGVGKGEVVCICTDKNFEYLPTVVGIICAGATFSPMDPTYGRFPLLHRLNIARPKVMFCSLSAYETHKKTFEEVGSIQHYVLYGNETKDGAVLFKELLTGTIQLEEFEPVPVNGRDDVAFVLYSSGTTGLPKGVPFTHLSFLSDSQHMLVIESKGVGVYNSGEFYGSYSFIYALACLRANATIVFNPSGGEKNMLEAVQKYQLRVLQLLPMVAIGLATSAILDSYDVSSVEYIIATGTHIWDEAVRGIEQRFSKPMRVLRQYGLTETGLICHEQFATKGSKAESAGKLGNGVVVKVVDLETRESVGPNQRGEICVNGYCVIKAYSNNAVPDFKDEEGFLKTGDIGYYDSDGYIFLVNRLKEMIKFNGIAIAPAEFEALLLQHPSVREAGVVGKPHPKHGQVPAAFIVLQPGCSATEEELVQHLDSRVTFRMRLAGGVRFIDRLPRTRIGDKLDRKDLMQRLLDEDANSN